MSRTINIPGLPVSTVQELLSTLAGNPNAFSDTSNIRRFEFYDTVNYPSAGITAPLQFFIQRQGNEYQTNWPSNGLGNNEVFVLQSIRFKLLSGTVLNSSQNPVAVGASNPGTGATAAFGRAATTATLDTNGVAARIAALESMRVAIENTKVFVRIGDLLIAEVMGLDSFPAGRGLDASIATSGTYAATTERITALFNNGLPMRSNGWAVTPNRAVLPSDRFLVELRQGAALPLGAADDTFAIRAIAEGIFITPTGK